MQDPRLVIYRIHVETIWFYRCSKWHIPDDTLITENDTATVNIPVTVNHSTGNVTFNITARDAQNHTLYVTDANLTSGYVFVDTIKPNLTINGNNTTIELYSEYIDQGANVTDEDPAYNYTHNIQH